MNSFATDECRCVDGTLPQGVRNHLDGCAFFAPPESRMTAIRFYSHRRGPWAFLSNFYPSPITIDGRTWPTVEHYFQAMKCPERAEEVRLARSPAEAKRLGRGMPLAGDWNMLRDDIMLAALRAKFADVELLARLLATGDSPLIEAAPRDYYWGEGDGSGMNRLGALLMQVRAELNREITEAWQEPPLERSADSRTLYAVQRCEDLAYLLPSEPTEPLEWVNAFSAAELFDSKDYAQMALDAVTRRNEEEARIVEVTARVMTPAAAAELLETTGAFRRRQPHPRECS